MGENRASSREAMPRVARMRMALGARLRAYFLAGILITAPVFVTLYVAWAFITFVDEKIGSLIPASYNPEQYLPFSIPGLGLVALVVGLTMVGALTAGFVGRQFTRLSEGIFARMPVIRGIYSATKQIFETVFSQKSNAFREAVMIEYPRPGLWTIAFVTGRPQGEIGRMADTDMVMVYVPTTPNPTSGFLLYVSRRDIVPLRMTVEEAIKLVVSTGIVTPPDRGPSVIPPEHRIGGAGKD
ncbi:MAG: DUF502 domain-containing protein [Alphaproteobacteria bacterium]|nr:DUF502 domain-containing protein [Alphaproteobacteria bacterium]